MNLQITLDLNEFLDFATQSLGYCSLVNYPTIVEVCKQFHPSELYLDGVELYTKEGWITEQKRREEITHLSKRFHETNKPILKIEKSKSLIDRIIAATESGDKEELAKIQEIMKLMKESK